MGLLVLLLRNQLLRQDFEAIALESATREQTNWEDAARPTLFLLCPCEVVWGKIILDTHFADSV